MAGARTRPSSSRASRSATTASGSTSSSCSTSTPIGPRSSAAWPAASWPVWAGPAGSSSRGDLEAALEGADFVIVQLRVGGQAARFVDETLPPRFGTIGQETTGAGGFAKALRTVPVVLDIAEEADRLAAPGHWIVDFTNPVGIVTQALLDDGHRAIGLCNVAIGFQRRFAARFGVEPERVELEHVGLNHLTWIRAVRVDGVDRLPELLDEDGDAIAADVGVPSAFVRSLRAIPSYYLRYYYLFETVLADQRRDGHATRAEEVAKIERELLAMYRDPTLDEKPALLANRGGAFYSEAAAQLIASLEAGSGDVQVVNIRNDGALAGLPDDAVVEIPARIDRDGAHPVELRPLEPDMLALVQAVKALRAAGDPGGNERRSPDRSAGARREPARRRRRRRRAAARRPARGERGVPAGLRRLRRALSRA